MAMKLNRERVITIIVVVLVAAGGVIFWYQNQPHVPQAQQLVPLASNSSEYSASGKITAIKGNVLTLEVNQLYSGANGNFSDHVTKQAVINTGVSITKLTQQGKNVVSSDASLSDLKVGMTITLYSKSDITQLSYFAPTRITYMP